MENQVNTPLHCKMCGHQIQGNYYECNVGFGVNLVKHHHNGIDSSKKVEEIILPYSEYSVCDIVSENALRVVTANCEKGVYCSRYCHDRHCETYHRLVPNSLPETWNYDGWQETIPKKLVVAQ